MEQSLAGNNTRETPTIDFAFFRIPSFESSRLIPLRQAIYANEPNGFAKIFTY